MVDPVTPEQLDAIWEQASSEARMWAVDQARQMVGWSSPLPLGMQEVMDAAQLLIMEISRRPPAPSFEDTGNETSPQWMRNRGFR